MTWNIPRGLPKSTKIKTIYPILPRLWYLENESVWVQSGCRGADGSTANFGLDFTLANDFQNQIFFFLLINKLTKNSKQQKPCIFIHQRILETSLSFAQKPEYATFDFWNFYLSWPFWNSNDLNWFKRLY